MYCNMIGQNVTTIGTIIIDKDISEKKTKLKQKVPFKAKLKQHCIIGLS